MATKAQYVETCKKILTKHASMDALKSALDEMVEVKLKDIKDSEIIGDRKIDDCNAILSARITIFKGMKDAEEFLHEVDSWRGYE